MIPVQVQHVGRVSGCNHLNRFALFPVVLRVGQPIERVANVSQQSWVDASVGFLQAHDGRRVWSIHQGQESEREKRTLGEVSCGDPVTSDSRAEQNRLLTR